MRNWWRAIGAAAAFLAVGGLLVAVFSFAGGIAVFGLLDRALPPLDSSAPGSPNYNTNTGYQWPLFLPVGIAGGLIAASVAWEPRVSRRRELLLTLVAFAVLASLSGYNFVVHDDLFRRSAQALLDLAMAVTGGALVVNVLAWRPRRAIAIALRTCGLFLLTGAGVALPLVYASNFLLPRLGLATPVGEIKDAVELVVAVVSLGPALFSVRHSSGTAPALAGEPGAD